MLLTTLHRYIEHTYDIFVLFPFLVYVVLINEVILQCEWNTIDKECSDIT